MKARVLAFAACMRSHRVPGYPDPTFSNGGVSQGYGPKTGVDPNSPIFQAAQKTCGGKLGSHQSTGGVVVNGGRAATSNRRSDGGHARQGQ